MVWKSTRKGKHYQTKDSADNSNFRIDPHLIVKERTKKVMVTGRKSKPKQVSNYRIDPRLVVKERTKKVMVTGRKLKPKHKEQIINPTEDKKLIKAVQNGASIYKKDGIALIDSSNPKKIEKEFR